MKCDPERRLGERLGRMVDFWSWAFADLKANNLRGVFAEWMVAQLLGLAPPPRDSWDDHDLLLPDGRKIEVKAGAFCQVWHEADSPPSSIVFTGLKGRRWDRATRRYAAEPTHNADLYVFRVQIETGHARWDAFDLTQWRFHVVPRDRLETHGAASVRLATVARFAPVLRAEELRTAVLGAAGGTAEASPGAAA